MSLPAPPTVGGAGGPPRAEAGAERGEPGLAVGASAAGDGNM